MATTNQGADALAAPTLAVDEIEGILGAWCFGRAWKTMSEGLIRSPLRCSVLLASIDARACRQIPTAVAASATSESVVRASPRAGLDRAGHSHGRTQFRCSARHWLRWRASC